MNDWRIHARRLLMAMIIAMLAGFSLNFVVDNPYAHRVTARVVNRALAKYTNIDVRYEAMRLSVMPPGIELFGVRVRRVDPNSPDMVSASRVRVRLSMWSLLLGEPRLGLVELVDTEAVWPLPGGIDGLLKPSKADPRSMKPCARDWPPCVIFPVEHIALRNARLAARIPISGAKPEGSADLYAGTSGIDVDYWHDDWSDTRLRVDGTGVSFAQGSMSYLEDARVRADVTTDGATISSGTLAIVSPRVNMSVDLGGQMIVPDDGLIRGIKVNARASGGIDFSVLGSYLDIEETRGWVEAKTDVDAYIPLVGDKPARFRVTGEGQARDGVMYGFRVRDSKAKFTVDTEKFTIDEGEVLIGDRSLGTVRGSVWFDQAVRYRFTAKPAGIRLSELLDALAVDFSVVDSEIHSPDLVIEGQGLPFSMSVRGTGAFTRVSLPTMPYDHHAFPSPPACLLSVNMAIVSTGMRFDGTRGNCFSIDSDKVTDFAGRVLAGRLEVPEASGDRSPLSVTGPLWFDARRGLDLRVVAPETSLGLSRWFAQIAVEGRGGVSARVHGPFDRVIVDASASIEETRVAGVPLGKVQGSFQVTPEDVSWTDVTAILPQGGQFAMDRGRLLLDDDSTIEIRATIDQVTRAQTADWIQLGGLRGAAVDVEHATVEMRGPVAHPLAWQGSASIALGAIDVDDAKTFDGLAGTLRSDATGWSSDGLVGRMGATKARLSFRQTRSAPFLRSAAIGKRDSLERLGIGANDTWKVDLSTEEASQGRSVGRSTVTDSTDNALGLARLPLAGVALTSAGIDGIPVASVSLSGRLNAMKGRFQGDARRLRVFGASLAPIRFSGFVDNGKLDVMLSHAGSSLEGRVNVDTTRNGVPYEWYFHASRLDARVLTPSLFYSDPRNFAYLSGNWRMKGLFADWWRSEGEATIEGIQARFMASGTGTPVPAEMSLVRPVTLRMRPSGWVIDDQRAVELVGRYARVSLTTGDNRLPDKIDVSFSGMADLALVRSVTTKVENAGGQLRVEGRLSGDANAPSMLLSVRDATPEDVTNGSWEPVSFGLAEIRPSFKNIKVDVKFDGNRLLVNTLEADKGAGKVRVSGVVGLLDDGGRASDTNIDVSLENATVIYPVGLLKSFDTVLNGTVTVTGARAPYNIGGSLEISRARSTREVDIRDEIVNALQRQRVSSDSGVAARPTVNLDLTIQAPGSIVVTNRNIRGVAGGTLQLTGTDVAPVVSGQMEITKGRFNYRRDFNVTRGIVTFDDPVRPDPRLDIAAASEVGNHRVFVNISGRASDAKVDLSIDPPTREDGSPINKMEILVLLSTGTLPDASRAVGETKTAARTEALNLLAGQFEEPVEKIFDMSGQSLVRQVYIDTYSEQTTGAPVARFNVPLNIMDRLDAVMRYDQSGNWKGSLEYSLHESISLSGSFDGQRKNEVQAEQSQAVGTDTGVDLKFRFSFP